MIDIRFLRENPEAVKENIRKKFQDAKLPLVDEVVDLDAKRRAAIAEVESLKAARNKLSKANGPLYGQLKSVTTRQKGGAAGADRPQQRCRQGRRRPPGRARPVGFSDGRASARSCM